MTDAQVLTAFSHLAYLTTRSATHIGCGEAIGDVDQPVVRNPTTQMPCVPSSALKRSLKDHCSLPAEEKTILFGSENGRAGHLSPQEAQLLLLPIASGAGGQAWVTSPTLLHSFARHAARCEEGDPLPLIESVRDEEVLLSTGSSPLIYPGAKGKATAALLDYRLSVKTADDQLAQWVSSLAQRAFAAEDGEWQKLVSSRLAIVSDSMMLALAERLDIRTRNAIGDDGAAENLWREETVPEDTVFYTVMAAHPLTGGSDGAGLAYVKRWLNGMVSKPLLIQVGGNASLGQGWVSLHVAANGVLQ